MDLEYIESLAELVRQTAVAEVTVRRGSRSVTLRRQPGGVHPALALEAPAPTPATDITAWSPRPLPLVPLPAGGGGALVATGEKPASVATEILKAHRVGVFHRARREAGEPLVTVGDWVAAGQQLASIESMKLYDEVDAPLSGRIIGVFVEESAPVEFGQPLFHIQQSDSPDEDGEADEPEEVAV